MTTDQQGEERDDAPEDDFASIASELRHYLAFLSDIGVSHLRPGDIDQRASLTDPNVEWPKPSPAVTISPPKPLEGEAPEQESIPDTEPEVDIESQPDTANTPALVAAVDEKTCETPQDTGPAPLPDEDDDEEVADEAIPPAEEEPAEPVDASPELDEHRHQAEEEKRIAEELAELDATMPKGQLDLFGAAMSPEPETNKPERKKKAVAKKRPAKKKPGSKKTGKKSSE